jgi:hypothetical protein
MNIEIKVASAPGVERGGTAFEPAGGPADARCAGLEQALGDMRDRWMRAEAETVNVRARAPGATPRMPGSMRSRASPAAS